jgi:glycosyltransferase involved in cell wall biosynthesis
MKILVLAQTPPPVHGQSLMVRAMIDGLPRLGINVRHVPVELSKTHDDIGKWRPGKAIAAIRAGLAARRIGRTEAFDALYYVPAPGKRGALWRDLIVLGLARPAFKRMVLHWHAPGLGTWLEKRATGPERMAARRLLGRADLSIVLAHTLRRDAEMLGARRIAIVSNGVPDPGPHKRRHATPGRPWQILFLGQCSEEKGLFAAAEAVITANKEDRQASGQPSYTLLAAGPFPRPSDEKAFAALARRYTGEVRHVGEVSGESKRSLFLESDCLCLPTRYPHEGQPLVVLEALAFDLPIVATPWRAIADTLPPEAGTLVPPSDNGALTDALRAIRARPPEPGLARAAYLKEFTEELHLKRLASELLRMIGSDP